MTICHASLAQDVLTEMDQVIGVYNSWEELKDAGHGDTVDQEIINYTYDCFPGLEDLRDNWIKVMKEFRKLINARS